MTDSRLPRAVHDKLESAAKAATMLNDRCTVPVEHQEAMRLYLDTWVVARIESVLLWSDGTLDSHDLSDY